MIETVQKWEDLVHATGGSMAPNKCWWYLVDHTWTQTKWKITNAESTPDLKVLDHTGTRRTVRRLPIHESKEMLGVFMAPDGTKTEQGEAEAVSTEK